MAAVLIQQTFTLQYSYKSLDIHISNKSYEQKYFMYYNEFKISWHTVKLCVSHFLPSKMNTTGT